MADGRGAPMPDSRRDALAGGRRPRYRRALRPRPLPRAGPWAWSTGPAPSRHRERWRLAACLTARSTRRGASTSTRSPARSGSGSTRPATVPDRRSAPARMMSRARCTVDLLHAPRARAGRRSADNAARLHGVPEAAFDPTPARSATSGTRTARGSERPDRRTARAGRCWPWDGARGLRPRSPLRLEARALFSAALPAAHRLPSPRAVASAHPRVRCGARGALRRTTRSRRSRHLVGRPPPRVRAAVDRDGDWPWPEQVLTYENALPAAGADRGRAHGSRDPASGGSGLGDPRLAHPRPDLARRERSRRSATTAGGRRAARAAGSTSSRSRRPR